MNTVVNHKSKDILQVSWAENTQVPGKSQRHKNAGTEIAIAWGSYPGQAIASRRAAQERRSKQTWPVTPDSTASERRFSRSSDEASDTTLKAVFLFRAETSTSEQVNKTRRASVSPRTFAGRNIYCLGGSCPRESLTR